MPHIAGSTNRVSGLPLRGLAKVVERANDLKKRVSRTLADSLVEVVEEAKKLERARLDVREEVAPGRREDGTNGVGGDLLLDVDTTADVKEIIDVDLLIVHVLGVVGDVDRIRRRKPRREVGGRLGVSDYRRNC